MQAEIKKMKTKKMKTKKIKSRLMKVVMMKVIKMKVMKMKVMKMKMMRKVYSQMMMVKKNNFKNMEKSQLLSVLRIKRKFF